MNTNVERLEDNKVKVTMTVPAADVDSHIKATYREIANKNRFPGFRKGKAPRGVIDANFGREYILAATTEDLINELFPRAVDEADIRPIKQADFGDMKDVSVVEGEDFTISAIIEDTPTLELSSYDPVQIELIDEKATEKEIDDQVNSMAQYYFSLNDVTDRAAKDGDYATIDIKVTYGDKEIPAYTNPDRMYEVGSDTLPQILGEHVAGMTVEQVEEFEFEPEEGMLASVDAGDDDAPKLSCRIELKELRERVYPEINDEFAHDTAGFEDLADMRQKIAESIERQKAAIIPNMKEHACAEKIVERLEGDVPEEMVQSKQQEVLREFFQMLQRQNMTFDSYLEQYGTTPNEFQDDMKKRAQQDVAEELALDAIARHFDMQVTEDEVLEEFKKAAPDDAEKRLAEWRDAGNLAFIREGIRRMKASEWLIDNAVVTTIDPDAAKDADAKGEGAADAAKGEGAAQDGEDAEAQADAE